MPSPTPWLDQSAWISLMATLASVPPAIDAQRKCDSGLDFFEYSMLSQLPAPRPRCR